MKNGKRHLNDDGQLELPAFAPVVSIPTIMLPQGDGSFLLKPGKPVVESDTIGTRKAARILGLSQRRIQSMCDEGEIEAYRMGGGRTPHYRIPLRAVMERKERE